MDGAFQGDGFGAELATFDRDMDGRLELAVLGAGRLSVFDPGSGAELSNVVPGDPRRSVAHLIALANVAPQRILRPASMPRRSTSTVGECGASPSRVPWSWPCAEGQLRPVSRRSGSTRDPGRCNSPVGVD